MTHYLKTWPEYFQEVYDGKKGFELRKDDRNFQVGNTLGLQEYNLNLALHFGEEKKGYSGREVSVSVTHILRYFSGIEPGYCIMSIIH